MRERKRLSDFVDAAREYVRGYAATTCAEVDPEFVAAIVAAVGEISVDEAFDALDKAAAEAREGRVR